MAQCAKMYSISSCKKSMIGSAWCRERDDAVKAAGRADAQSGKQAEDADLRQNKSSAAVKRLEGDAAKLQSQVATLEHANRFVSSTSSLVGSQCTVCNLHSAMKLQSG